MYAIKRSSHRPSHSFLQTIYGSSCGYFGIHLHLGLQLYKITPTCFTVVNDPYFRVGEGFIFATYIMARITVWIQPELQDNGAYSTNSSCLPTTLKENCLQVWDLNNKLHASAAETKSTKVWLDKEGRSRLSVYITLMMTSWNELGTCRHRRTSVWDVKCLYKKGTLKFYRATCI